MTKRETTLKFALKKEFGIGIHTRPNHEDFYVSKYSSEIDRIYSNLGGILFQYPTNYKGYDIILKNFIVELDEERHFNRYRKITLQSEFYNDNSINVGKYQHYCSIHEIDCLKAASWGKNWSNPSTEKQFGVSSLPGDFQGNGSARWKQRAFYDYLRDISQFVSNIPLIRISIWDTIDKFTVNDLLNKNQVSPIISLINSKI